MAHFLRKHAQGSTTITVYKETMHRLTAYSWPGNVRELENVIERAVTLSQGGVVTIGDLPQRIRLQQSHDMPPLSADDLTELFSGLPNLDEIERRYILRVLDATGNNRKRTAEILSINRKTLYRMAARFLDRICALTQLHVGTILRARKKLLLAYPVTPLARQAQEKPS